MPGTADILLRDDLRAFAGYSSARSCAVLRGDAWLNANESPTASPADADGALRRYPDPQPAELREALAALYGVPVPQLLATRGSDEGIDLLLRATCLPGRGAIVTTPPTFGMYAVCARLHGVRMLEVPMRVGDEGFRADLDAVGDAALAAKTWEGEIEGLNSNLAPKDAGLVIDAVFGTGFSGPLAPEIVTLFDKIRAKKIPVVAVDAPRCPTLFLASEDDADIPPAAVRALAVRFSADFRSIPAASHVGPLLGRAAASVAADAAGWLAGRLDPPQA